MTTTRPSKVPVPIVDPVAALDLMVEWVKCINHHDVQGMIAAQKQLRADHGVWLCFGTRPPSGRVGL